MLRERSRHLPGRLGLSLLAMVRVLSLLLGLQLSNALHVAEDVVALVVVDHAEHEQCPADRPCDDCPPGCPQCHCSNALRSLAPTNPVSFAFAFAPKVMGNLATGEQAPMPPELPGVFRPPQAALAS